MIQSNLQRVIVGSALVIATTALIPIARQTLRPVVRDLSKQMKYFLVSAKEGLEDMAAEVKFERMKKQMSQDMLIDCDVEIEEQTGRIFH
ncbi:putative neutral ceramidase superfamily lipid hydrolase [Bacillus fengqiuensis]|nr:putative neutral ceramidase superfamily lipid hydrolase [Bacillus fengqiuensis]